MNRFMLALVFSLLTLALPTLASMHASNAKAESTREVTLLLLDSLIVRGDHSILSQAELFTIRQRVALSGTQTTNDTPALRIYKAMMETGRSDASFPLAQDLVRQAAAGGNTSVGNGG